MCLHPYMDGIIQAGHTVWKCFYFYILIDLGFKRQRVMSPLLTKRDKTMNCERTETHYIWLQCKHWAYRYSICPWFSWWKCWICSTALRCIRSYGHHHYTAPSFHDFFIDDFLSFIQKPFWIHQVHKPSFELNSGYILCLGTTHKNKHSN